MMTLYHEHRPVNLSTSSKRPALTCLHPWMGVIPADRDASGYGYTCSFSSMRKRKRYVDPFQIVAMASRGNACLFDAGPEW